MSLHRFLAVAALALAALASSPSADAQATRQAVSADEVIAALRTEGATDIESYLDDDGDPEINAMVQGLRFGVIFYRCDRAQPQRCEQIQFRSSFAPDGPRAAALEKVDEWNRTWVFGKAYLDQENAYFFEHAFYASGGVTQENIRINASLWIEIVADFARHIGYRN